MSRMTEQTRKSVIEAAKIAAARTGGPVSRSDFIRLSGVSAYYLYRLFPDGGWSEVQRLAGIDPHPHNTQPISDDELLAEFHRVVSKFGSIPTWHKFDSLAAVSADTIRRRFGGAKGTFGAYRNGLEGNDPNSSMLAVLIERTNSVPERPQTPAAPKSAAWTKLDGIEYGAPINFRGLRHAPINEQGVVYLFGMVSNELGLIVEAVQAGFPDCDAKRCVNAKTNR